MGFPKNEFRDVLRTITDVHPENIVWDGEPEPFILPVPGEYVGQITLSVSAVTHQGTSEVQRNFAAQKETSIGWRIATVTIQLELFGAEEAYDELDVLRLRFRRSAVRKALREAGLALVDTPSVTNLDGVVDNRATSVATLDIRLAFAITDVIEGEDTEGYIDSIEDPVGPVAPS